MRALKTLIFTQYINGVTKMIEICENCGAEYVGLFCPECGEVPDAEDVEDAAD